MVDEIGAGGKHGKLCSRWKTVACAIRLMDQSDDAEWEGDNRERICPKPMNRSSDLTLEVERRYDLGPWNLDHHRTMRICPERILSTGRRHAEPRRLT